MADLTKLIQPEDLVGEEWYRLTPQERWQETQRLWQTYLYLGGSLDPEPDTQSPFYDPEESGPCPPDRRTGMRVIRRSGI